MSISIRFLTLFLILLFSNTASSQAISYQYQMDGFYQAGLPGLTAPQGVRFTILWNENKGAIDGVYGDSLFSSNSKVTGTTGTYGRVFNVQLPRVIQGVSRLSFVTSLTNLAGGSLPVQVFMKDWVGQTIAQTNISSSVTLRSPDDNPPPTACDVGFGALSGYCGLYGGNISEIADSGNNCNLPDYGFRFELNADSRTRLFFYYSDTTIGIPNHDLGTLPAAPLSSTLNLSSRHCGVLLGTNFNNTNCQILNMNGTFTEVGEGRNFRGRYTIIEETTGNTCTYDINVNREKTY